MTLRLEQHRSSLIPTVSFAAGGRIVVDGDGTFPLSHGKRRDRLPDFKNTDDNENTLKPDNSDLESFRSYDPKRKPRFLKRDSSRYGEEVNRMSNTLSSGGSRSLQRKLRRFRGKDNEEEDLYNNGPEFGSLNLVGTMSDRGRSRRPASHPSATPYPGSLGRSSGKVKAKQRLNMDTIRGSMRKPKVTEEVYSKNGSAPIFANGNLATEVPEVLDVRDKKIAEEKLPAAFFIIGGAIMFVLALVKLLLSWWQAYYSPLWTSISITCLGIFGILHRGDYLTIWRNAAYILFGALSVGGTLVCSGLLLEELAPQVVQLGSGFTGQQVAASSNTTSLGKSLVGSLAVDQVVSLNIGVDFAILVLCMVNFYSLTATTVAISNHWDAVYTVTGDCDHRGNPRLFNPLEQAILGLIACFIGLAAMGFTQYDKSLFGIPAIAGALVIVAGLASFCYGKRPDLLALGLTGLVLEFIALAACGVATVFLTLALVEDAQLVTETTVITDKIAGVNNHAALSAQRSQSIAALVFIGLFFLMMIVNVIFASGLLFRVCRKACCVCLDEDELLNESRY